MPVPNIVQNPCNDETKHLFYLTDFVWPTLRYAETPVIGTTMSHIASKTNVVLFHLFMILAAI